jgi:methionyl aminopeptidase
MLTGKASEPVVVRSMAEVDAMRAACSMAAETLLGVGELIRPGLTGSEIDEFVHEDTVNRGGVPATLGYRGYPKSVCVSVNDCICHGLPGPEPLRDGDIVNVDITTIYGGWHGDTSATFYVGTRSGAATLVVEAARAALSAGIAEVRPGARLGDVGAAVQELVEARGLSTVRDFYGHGIGRRFHEPPNVPHFGVRGRGMRLKAGMVFTVEPMINGGSHAARILEDGWTAVTLDGSLSAQFEHTVAVTEDGCEVLTARGRPLANSE